MLRFFELNRLWPWMARYTAAYIGIFALIVLVNTVASSDSRTTLTRMSFLLLMATLIVSCVHKYSFEVNLKRRLRLEDFQVCPSCLFSLRSQGPRCPECGELVDLSTLKSRWERILGTEL